MTPVVKTRCTVSSLIVSFSSFFFRMCSLYGLYRFCFVECVHASVFFSCACSRLFLGHRRDVFGATHTHTQRARYPSSHQHYTTPRLVRALFFGAKGGGSVNRRGARYPFELKTNADTLAWGPVSPFTLLARTSTMRREAARRQWRDEQKQSSLFTK